jgi:ubiquinone/menaquinone biosynthesis C-methylase UbiE
MKEALALMPFDRAQALSAVDIGAGYGLFASEILTAFPFVTVTLQDVSEPMNDLGRTRLAEHADRIRFVRSDLSSPSWTASLGGQFDLAVSSIAIHNLYDLGRIAQVYSEIHEVLKPGGAFINLDHISRVGGVEGQTDWLRQAGFVEVECVEITERLARLSGKKAP